MMHRTAPALDRRAFLAAGSAALEMNAPAPHISAHFIILVRDTIVRSAGSESIQ